MTAHVTSELYYKARVLRLTSALFRYSARSLRHRYERTQFTIRFIEEIEKLVPRTLFSSISTWEHFKRTLEKCENHEPKARSALSVINLHSCYNFARVLHENAIVFS